MAASAGCVVISWNKMPFSCFNSNGREDLKPKALNLPAFELLGLGINYRSFYSVEFVAMEMSKMSARPRLYGDQSVFLPVLRRLRISPVFNTLLLGLALTLAANVSAFAAVEITIDKSTQKMSVAVNGTPRYTWSVSSGLPAHETPNGTFKAFRMEADHYSKEWDDAPMPHSIFFTKVGHAIHGTDSVRRLGSPASHGCVRLSRQNAAALYALVEKEGVLNTTVTLTGSSQIALARGTRDVARDDTSGDPVQLAPRGYVTKKFTQSVVDNPDSLAEIYVDQYGRPVSTNRNSNYVNSNAADRRSYQNPQRNEADAYAQQYYRQPYQPRGLFFNTP
jgi:hypothetical protein